MPASTRRRHVDWAADRQGRWLPARVYGATLNGPALNRTKSNGRSLTMCAATTAASYGGDVGMGMFSAHSRPSMPPYRRMPGRAWDK